MTYYYHPQDEPQDRDRDASKRRNTDEKPCRQVRNRAFSTREETLLTLIDGHIARINAISAERAMERQIDKFDSDLEA